MSTLLIGSGSVISKDPKSPYLEEGCVYVDGGLMVRQDRRQGGICMAGGKQRGVYERDDWKVYAAWV